MSFLKTLSVIMVSLPCLLLCGMNGIASAETESASGAHSALFSGQQETTLSRQIYNPLAGPDYPLVQDSYFTDDSGNILMIVNVLGEVNKQGQVVVRENVDFATILALSEGLKKDANLRHVLVARREPDRNGVQAYVIDLKKYYKHGDRSSFIALKPNDTVIIPEKSFSIDKLAKVIGVVYPWAYIYSNLKN